MVDFSSNLRLQSITGKQRFQKEHDIGTKPNVLINGVEHKTQIQINKSTTTCTFTKTPEPEAHVGEKLPSQCTENTGYPCEEEYNTRSETISKSLIK